MRLYHCLAISVDYEPSDYVIAKSEEEAIEIFKNKLDKDDIWYGGFVSAIEVKVDGYDIRVVKKISQEEFVSSNDYFKD